MAKVAKKMRRFVAEVTTGSEEAQVPIVAADYETAQRLAVAYVFQVLRLEDFELRLVGA